MNKYSLILLDLDGTSANTDELIVQSMYHFYDKYNNGIRRPKEEIYYFSGPPIGETMKKEFPNYDSNELRNEFIEVSSKLYDEYVDPYPSCKEELLKLKNDGLKLVIVTSKSHALAELTLKVVGLDSVIDFVIAFDDVAKPKPNPEGCLKAMKLTNITDKRKVLYIGDNESDFETANNAGIDCCLVTFGPRVLNKNLKPKYKMDSYEELGGIVYE